METKRTKEQLIAARTEPLSLPLGTPACLLASGQTRKALDMLAQHAGMQWRYNTLFHFDLRQVDEQGRLVADGALSLDPPEHCKACGSLAARGHHRDRWCEEHTPEEHRHNGTRLVGEGLFWKAGEHLDAVLARGAARVTERVQRLLTKAPSLPADVTSARPILALDRAKEVLREQGYDVVPRIRWEDVRSWLLSLDCKVEERPERCEMLISQGDHEKDGWALLTMWPARTNELLEQLGKRLNMATREVRAAVEGHVAGKAAAMPVAARRAIEHSRAAGLSTKGASAVIRDAMSKFAAIEQGRDGKGPRIGMLFASTTAADKYARDSALGDKARAFHPLRPPVGERFDVLLVAADVPEDFLRYGLSRCVPGAVIATLAPPQSLGPARDPQDEPWTAARLTRQSLSRLRRLDAACRISDQPNDLRDANLKAMVETEALSHAEARAAMRESVEPPGRPMVVTTASGGTVDLRDPLSIRAGMRFYSPHWRNHCTPTGVLTVVRPDRSGGWECAEGVHCDPTTAALFLGCNPLYASSVDFAEFGAAPPLPARS